MWITNPVIWITNPVAPQGGSRCQSCPTRCASLIHCLVNYVYKLIYLIDSPNLPGGKHHVCSGALATFHVWQVVNCADVSTRSHIASQMRTDAPVIAPAPPHQIPNTQKSRPGQNRGKIQDPRVCPRRVWRIGHAPRCR